MSKYIDLAKKLKALAERGIGGEKFNARYKLNKLLAKHGILRSQLDEELCEWNKFKIPKSQRKFFIQIAKSVLGKKLESYHLHRSIISLYTTKGEVIEITSKHEFYWKAYQEEIEILFQAFVIKNYLFPLELDPNPALAKELSKEEIDKLKRSLSMVSGIKSTTFHKRISPHE